MRFIVSTAPGLEPLLAEELQELGLETTPSGAGALTFEGEWLDAARVMTNSRIGSRLMLSIKEFSAKNSAMLYDQVRRVKWTDWLTTETTFAVSVHGSVVGTDFALSFAPLKIKDAICDEMKKLGVDRPNIDRKTPDVRIEAFVNSGRCEISIDLGKEPLHRRGYRTSGGEAPLRENRAAALLKFVGYDGSQPFWDPFCGSGTIAIEAALIATHTAPGLLKEPQSYANIWAERPDARDALKVARKEAEAKRIKKAPASIRASDKSAKALDETRANIRRAGFLDSIQVGKADASQIEAPDHFIVCNPPYGVRLEEQEHAAEILADFTRQVKHKSTGSTLGLVVEAGMLEKAVGFKPARKMNIQNGQMLTKFLKYEIFSGKREVKKESTNS